MTTPYETLKSAQDTLREIRRLVHDRSGIMLEGLHFEIDLEVTLSFIHRKGWHHLSFYRNGPNDGTMEEIASFIIQRMETIRGGEHASDP